MMGYQRTYLKRRMYDTLTDLGYEFAEQLSTFSGFVIGFAIYHNRQAGQMIAIEVHRATCEAHRVQRGSSHGISFCM